MNCYNIIDDLDGDGYARAGAPGYWLDRGDGLHCPNPGTWVDQAGDCDDHNPFVHPRTDEIDGNGIDDNCSALDPGPNVSAADEPIAYFAGAEGFDRTPTSFGMVVRLNDPVLTSWVARKLRLRAEVEIAPLDASNHVQRRYLPYGSDVTLDLAHLTVPDLLPDKVYRVQVRFTSCVLFPVTSSCRTTPWSNPFYGATGSYTNDGEIRAQIVSSALSQFKDSSYQQVGYGGGDGNRYGADYGEQWCSEFYSWVLDPFVSWNNGARPTTTNGLLFHFAMAGGGLSPLVTDGWNVPAVGRRGDYVAMDTNSDGEINHSGMLLAWDADRHKAWTVEGNHGNEVHISTRLPGTEIMKLGRLSK
ncbi:MAG: putative metal-binding motif-containing protein [Rhodanobacteraceae bacterium]|nr:putative metal-binding motif-containing protein [Rhodanobacteraceae bacterium]